MRHESIDLRAIIFKEGDVWVAQCLEFDIGAQAADLDTLDERLRAAMTAECDAALEATGKAFGGIPPAPEEYFNMYEACAGRYTPSRGNAIKRDGDKVNLELALCA